MKDLLIIALPWQRYDTTAIQLGVLQPFIRDAGYQVDTRHFYKDLISYVSPHTYMKVFDAYMGECVFAALLYPERYEQIKSTVTEIVDFRLQGTVNETVFKHPQLNSNLSKAEREQISRSTKNQHKLLVESQFDFDALVKTLKQFIADVYSSLDWADYKMIGFTTSHQQLIPTVILSQMIKQDFPSKPIVIGGALMTQEIPKSLLEIYQVFDYVISGEGEITLLELVQFVSKNDPLLQPEGILGLYWRKGSNIVFNGERQPIHDMDVLPIPDFDDYFQHELKKNSPWVFPKLTLEASRACVWGKCIYCNLNLQWKNKYRRKSHARVVEEIEVLSKRYKSNVITLCDTNVVDKVELFEMLAETPNDYRILAEVSPHMTRRGMKAMRDAGVRTIQVGIESFSHRIVDLYGRGHTVMRSIEMLKWASEYDLEIYYNIIINFPLDEDLDVQRSLDAMRYASHFMYPAIHDFSFTMDSPAYNNKDIFNISGFEYPDEIKAIYPETVVKKLGQLFSLTVHPIAKRPTGVNWDPVIEYINQWKSSYHANLGRPGIVYLDGGTFLTISIKNGGQGNDVSITIEDEYRSVYLACNDEAVTVAKIHNEIPQLSEQSIADILRELNDVGVVYSDGKKYFGLAIRENSVGNYPHITRKQKKPLLSKLPESPESRKKDIKQKLPASLFQKS